MVPLGRGCRTDAAHTSARQRRTGRTLLAEGLAGAASVNRLDPAAGSRCRAPGAGARMPADGHRSRAVAADRQNAQYVDGPAKSYSPSTACKASRCDGPRAIPGPVPPPLDHRTGPGVTRADGSVSPAAGGLAPPRATSTKPPVRVTSATTRPGPHPGAEQRQLIRTGGTEATEGTEGPMPPFERPWNNVQL